MIGGIALTLAYGFPIQTRNDPLITFVGDSFREISRVALPGTFLVDFIPLLKYVPAWVPGAGFQNVAKSCQESCRSMRDVPFEASVQHMVRLAYDMSLNHTAHLSK